MIVWLKIDQSYGRKLGINNREMLLALHEEGVGATDMAKQMGIGRSTVYKLLQ